MKARDVWFLCEVKNEFGKNALSWVGDIHDELSKLRHGDDEQ